MSSEPDFKRIQQVMRETGWVAWIMPKCGAVGVVWDPPLMADHATEVACTEPPGHDGPHRGATLIRIVTWGKGSR